MNPSSPAPELSEGARELLRITMESDTHHAIATNAALRYALEWLSRLHLSARASFTGLPALLKTENVPRTFLELTCKVLMCIQAELDKQYQSPIKSAEPLVTDFNRHVFQAFAETLADAAWPERSASDFNGPPLAQVAKRLSTQEEHELYRGLIRNYMGNILQDCFSAARVRENVPDLDPTTELNLRTQEGDVIAGFTMQTAMRRFHNLSPKLITSALQVALKAFSE
jgi:hypothetical protein